MRTLCDHGRTPRSDWTSLSTGKESQTQAQLATAGAEGKKHHTTHLINFCHVFCHARQSEIKQKD